MNNKDIENISVTTCDDIVIFVSNIFNKKPRYNTISIKKNNGGDRIISIPDKLTLNIQKQILFELNALNFDISPCSMAFKKSTSILDNAKMHLHNKYLIHYDLRDFFDNIFVDRVTKELAKKDVPPKFIKLVQKWCFFHGHLPQGAPTSPFLSNLVCEDMDRRFSILAEKINATYTRYADDIIISGDKNIFIYQTIYKRIIRTEKFFINHRKTRTSALNSPETLKDNPNASFFVPYHIVTGLTVDDEKVSIRPAYLNKLRQEIKNFLLPENPQGYKQFLHIVGKITFVFYIDPIEGKKFYELFLSQI